MDTLNLTEQEREIINLGISITAGCQPCTKYHVKKCRETDISEIEIQTIADQVMQLSTAASQIMKSRTLHILNITNNKTTEYNSGYESKRDVLVGLAVSYTMNNTDLFDYYLTLAGNMGIGDREISFITETSRFIFYKAKAHVDLLIENKGIVTLKYEEKDCSSKCGC